jgi:hypothetical protein
LYAGAAAALFIGGAGYLTCFGLHPPSWTDVSTRCERATREESVAVAEGWNVVIPEEATEVYRCTDGPGGGRAGTASFAFRIPRDRVTGYFARMGTEPLPGYDVRDSFTDFSVKAGHDVATAKRYEAGSRSEGYFSHTVLADEDAGDVVTVYVQAVSSG